MFSTAVVLLSVLVCQMLAAPISTDCDANVQYANNFFVALESASVANIQVLFAESYSGSSISFDLPNMYNPINTNITLYMDDWQWFFDHWHTDTIGAELTACFEDGRVLLRTNQTMTSMVSGKTVYNARSWYLLTFDTDGLIVYYEETYNNLLEVEAGHVSTTEATRVGRVSQRAGPELNCASVTKTLERLANAIAAKKSGTITQLYSHEYSGITPSFSLPDLYVPAGNISSQKAAWNHFFDAWIFDSQSFEIACDATYLGGAFFRHQQNMTSTATGTQVFFSQRWYYIVVDAHQKIVQIDNTWNTLLESTASGDYRQLSVLLLVVASVMSLLLI